MLSKIIDWGSLSLRKLGRGSPVRSGGVARRLGPAFMVEKWGKRAILEVIARTERNVPLIYGKTPFNEPSQLCYNDIDDIMIPGGQQGGDHL